MNAAHACGGKQHVLRPLRREVLVDVLLAAQIQVLARGQEQVVIAERAAAALERGTDETAATGDEDATGLFHASVHGGDGAEPFTRDQRVPAGQVHVRGDHFIDQLVETDGGRP